MAAAAASVEDMVYLLWSMVDGGGLVVVGRVSCACLCVCVYVEIERGVRRRGKGAYKRSLVGVRCIVVMMDIKKRGA